LASKTKRDAQRSTRGQDEGRLTPPRALRGNFGISERINKSLADVTERDGR
jgi:hypothetical protein